MSEQTTAKPRPQVVTWAPSHTEPVPPPAPITLLLPDGQAVERVRLYERQQLDTGLWRYRIGVPL
ncbi:hypothetical protein PV721_34705 [Streptomyces sp. MB09-01]|uniref:hypothetical protein n=1 Tax=Streptomyces sp. MB09-01 TaxID=3028666 RepID=UPI0029B0A184|nr:hypothetical protein [Streptomyces sp. MB09-01]MDX3539389.1 hypothetical protein [Streptomyces sp. MB09-01]